jgi:hypothetical protein
MKRIEPKPGERYNMLTFVEPAGRELSGAMKGRPLYASLGKWKCDCGKEVICRNRYVVNGIKKSCGCLLRAKGEAWRKGRRVNRHEPMDPIDNLAAAIRELAAAINRKEQNGEDSDSK